jgi:hypothetical protein
MISIKNNYHNGFIGGFGVKKGIIMKYLFAMRVVLFIALLGSALCINAVAEGEQPSLYLGGSFLAETPWGGFSVDYYPIADVELWISARIGVSVMLTEPIWLPLSASIGVGYNFIGTRDDEFRFGIAANYITPNMTLGNDEPIPLELFGLGPSFEFGYFYLRLYYYAFAYRFSGEWTPDVSDWSFSLFGGDSNLIDNLLLFPMPAFGFKIPVR